MILFGRIPSESLAECHHNPWPDAGRMVGRVSSYSLAGCHRNLWPYVVGICKYVTIEDYKQISNNREIIQRDILISMIGTLGEMAIVNSNDLPFYGQNMYLLRLNEGIVIPRYFYHFFDTDNMKTHFNKIKNASSQGYLKANHIEDIKIPVPPLAEQERIVAILDRFDALCNDLSRGLPAEIEARRQQYEYYRDKLLTFKEKTA